MPYQKHALSMVKSFMNEADIHAMRWEFRQSINGHNESLPSITVLPGQKSGARLSPPSA